MRQIALFLPSFLLLTACRQSETDADAYGNFEAVETIVSAEATGALQSFRVAEGQTLTAGQVVGQIDTEQLVLKRAQLVASQRSLTSRSPNLTEQLSYFSQQLAVQEEQLANARREQNRTRNLLTDGAATQKQFDEVTNQVAVLERQIALTRQQRTAQASTLKTQQSGLRADAGPIQEQIRQLDDQIQKSAVVNPSPGTVTVKFAEPGEVVSYGKALYKLADLKTITLRAYVGGDQLTRVKTGQAVTVRVDAPNDEFKTYTGRVDWIADRAEFTPKVIQTKEERVNLVYALKISVSNDGGLKIGMPGEVVF